ncbi:shikimate dehydrogenase [Pseudomonas sp. PS01302]|uniref:shikimate dehydrogenase family protein n=1 Tax=Pseudomonas sp. PS01302 TaxID=2991438 RepID=UPI00249AD7F1|nr:shikimate dehydrogenase [Pseudomonas sp. PS01302]
MEIIGSTKLVGIIADPISHVRTPEVINHSMARQGLNVVCVPLHVRPKNLAALLKGLPGLANLQGLVVTIPYKEEIVAHCHELSETAELVGSVNAVRIDEPTGKLIGGNFDGEGMVSGILNQGHSLEGKRVLLVGAGGAGKSIAYAVCKQNPSELAIHNRSSARAATLVERLQALFPNVALSVNDGNASGFDVVINATSLGLQDSDALPINPETLTPGALVCDAVIRAGNTAFLSAAHTRGCSIHHGQHMIYGQIIQICKFIGIDLQDEHLARILGP